ncbi:hypothetical protein KGP36_02360 [Patescibacteria group bacterium]|nr:hypothetical protein [Patescibacteria group bacterium]
MDKALRGKYTEAIVKATAAWIHKPGEKKEPKTMKGKQLKKVIEDGNPFGCKTRHVAAIVSILAGDRIDVEVREGVNDTIRRVPVLCAVIPTVEDSAHDYPLGEISIHLPGLNNTHALRPDGTVGNNLWQEEKDFRRPTEKELRNFLGERNDAWWKALAKKAPLP